MLGIAARSDLCFGLQPWQTQAYRAAGFVMTGMQACGYAVLVVSGWLVGQISPSA